jgi:hypothetical protein
MEDLYGYICDKHYTTCLTWVGWLAENDADLPCCSECGDSGKMRHVFTTKLDVGQVKKKK